MSGKKPKATRKRVISCFAQIVQEHIPGWKIEEIASGEKVKARKAAVKVHMVANVANRLPHFCVFGKAKDHDSKKEDELFGSLKAGDIGIADRAYNHFKALYRQTTRGVFFVVREKAGMKHKVVKKVPKKDLGANILSDETIRLTGQRTSKEYPGELRMVQARVQVDGKWRPMAFLTNNFEWAVFAIIPNPHTPQNHTNPGGATSPLPATTQIKLSQK